MYFKKSFLEECLTQEGKVFHNFDPLYESEAFLNLKSVLGISRSRSSHCLVFRTDCLSLNRDDINGDIHCGESIGESGEKWDEGELGHAN